jgi:hypothetical protein
MGVCMDTTGGIWRRAVVLAGWAGGGGEQGQTLGIIQAGGRSRTEHCLHKAGVHSWKEKNKRCAPARCGQ